MGVSYLGLWLFQEAGVPVGILLLSHTPVQPKGKNNTFETLQEIKIRSLKGLGTRE